MCEMKFCYQAANWIHVGKTAGEGNIYPNGKESEKSKAIYVYPLQCNWKKELCLEKEKKSGSLRRVSEPVDWVEDEFGRVEFYDDRLKARLHRLAAKQKYTKPPAKSRWLRVAKGYSIALVRSSRRIGQIRLHQSYLCAPCIQTPL